MTLQDKRIPYWQQQLGKAIEGYTPEQRFRHDIIVSSLTNDLHKSIAKARRSRCIHRAFLITLFLIWASALLTVLIWMK